MTDLVQLISIDGTSSKIPLDVAIQSPILKNLLTNPEFAEFHSRTVHLPSVSAGILNRVVEYLMFRKQSMDNEKIDLCGEFSIDPKEAVDLLQAADFLDI